MSSEQQSVINSYFEEIRAQFYSGHAKEHAYRPALKSLMEGFENTRAINDPKRSKHGNPDFVFLKSSNQSVIKGYAEAKDITVDLDKIEKSEQLKRYAGYDNLFLTNYLEFRFFKNGEKYQTISIGKVEGADLKFDFSQFSMLEYELSAFLELPPESIKNGRRLAQLMGAKARRIRDNVTLFLQEENDQNAEIEKIYKMMKKLLVHDLSIEKFSDMYSQTLVYGLFAARYNDKTTDDFSRAEARDLVPASNPFLREFFDHIAGVHFDKRLGYIVDEICEVFSVSDVKDIVHKHLRLDKETRDEKDPIIHFYEDFLKEYDPQERKRMGAYYTPLPVVKFIVREVDRILKEDFKISKGLADTTKRKFEVTNQGQKIKADLHEVQILDPAVGTATFLNEIIKHIHSSFKGQEGRWPSYVETDLLPRLYGFELMMAPYTIAHLKLSMTLQETGLDEFRQRLGVYLTNTLEEGIKQQQDLFSIGLAEAVSHEAEEAAKIKSERPIMVVIGNPPYSGVSSNETEYANNLIQKYKVEPGGLAKLKERKHWLNDDYVKFIAFAEDMIAKNGKGVVAMITNHGYLDNPTFRGMRWHLKKTFDKIYILDLHGNSKKKETSPDGSKDQNVFDIQQGVAIILGVKKGGNKTRKEASIYHSDIYGLRQEKFKQLQGEPQWQRIKDESRYHYFIPKDTKGQKEYEKGVKIDDLFRVYSTGVVTARDGVVIDTDKSRLLGRISKFVDLNYSDDEIRKWLFPHKKTGKYLLGDTRGWKLPAARRALQSLRLEKYLQEISYRPFDTRYIFYHPAMVDWDREKVMNNFIGENNVGLIVSRQAITDNWSHVQVSKNMADNRVHYSNKGIPVEIPLYLFHHGSKISNLNEKYLKSLAVNLTGKVSPDDVLGYIYTILHSYTYRKKYQEFLKTDFPRIPIPKNDKQFISLAKLGKQLIDIHLLKSQEIEDTSVSYPEIGSNVVEKVEYSNGKVFISEKQYFGNVPVEAWEFYIGGYQPAQKWLKDRKGQTLNNDDIEHYQKIIKALEYTKELMEDIDRCVTF